jgi:hypothetical protein
MIATTYEYPASERYNETVAVLPDGRRMTVDTQYAVVLPHGDHADGCAQVNVMGGRCDCGKLAGVDVGALVTEARANGRFGRAPKTRVAPVPAPVAAEWKSPRGLTLTEEMDREDTTY